MLNFMSMIYIQRVLYESNLSYSFILVFLKQCNVYTSWYENVHMNSTLTSLHFCSTCNLVPWVYLGSIRKAGHNSRIESSPPAYVRRITPSTMALLV